MTKQPRTVVSVDGLPPAPWSHGVSAGGWLFSGSLLATDYAHGLLSEARPDPKTPWIAEPLDLESNLVIDAMAAVLQAAGGDPRRDLLRMWQWIAASYPDDAAYARDRTHWPAHPSGTPYARNLMDRIADPLRSSTGIGVRALPMPGSMLAIDFIAHPGGGERKVRIDPPADLPAPKIGYSPAIRHGDWIFLAGFGATDFAGDWMSDRHMGEPSMIAPEARVNPYIWLGSEIEAQTRYTLHVMERLAQAAGSSLSRCVKADVTITHPSDFAGMDRVWKEYFPTDPPARNVVTGAQLVIKGLRIEVALLLLADDATASRTPVDVDQAFAPAGHAPQAMQAGDFLFTSTLLPTRDGAVPVDISDDIGAPRWQDKARQQTAALIEHTSRLCQAAGTSLDQVCKVQAFVSDMRHMPGMMRAWEDSFPKEPPALSCVETGGGDPLLTPGACVQWDVIAYISKELA